MRKRNTRQKSSQSQYANKSALETGDIVAKPVKERIDKVSKKSHVGKGVEAIPH